MFLVLPLPAGPLTLKGRYQFSLVPKRLGAKRAATSYARGFSSRLEKSGLSSPIIKDTTVFGGRIDGSGRLRMYAVALIPKNLGLNRQYHAPKGEKLQ